MKHDLVTDIGDADSRFHWAGLRRHELLVHRCADCGHVQFPPLPVCPSCGHPELVAVAASGGGAIYSWVVVHPQTAAADPYTIVTVDLVEGPRVFGRLLRGVPAPGADVQAEFYEAGPRTLLGFVSR